MPSLNVEFVSPHVNFVVDVTEGSVSESFFIIAGYSESGSFPVLSATRGLCLYITFASQYFSVMNSATSAASSALGESGFTAKPEAEPPPENAALPASYEAASSAG